MCEFLAQYVRFRYVRESPPLSYSGFLYNWMFSQVIHSTDRKMRPITGPETSSAKAEPFAAERPRILQCYMGGGESLKLLKLCHNHFFWYPTLSLTNIFRM
jgi:hypothetical protein